MSRVINVSAGRRVQEDGERGGGEDHCGVLINWRQQHNFSLELNSHFDKHDRSLTLRAGGRW